MDRMILLKNPTLKYIYSSAIRTIYNNINIISGINRMAIHFEKTTIGTDDFELGIKRKSILRYFLTLPEKKIIRGLLL